MATLFVGIDVAKEMLDITWRPNGQHFRVPNTPQGCDELVTRLLALGAAPADVRVILESTGGLELQAALAVEAAGLQVAIVKPERVRHYAQACGQLAKTDRLDAALLASFAEKMEVPIVPLPSEESRRFRDLLDRRHQLVEMQTMEQNRRSQTTARQAVQSLERHLKWLAGEIAKVEAEMNARVAANPQWREVDRLLQTIPGIGPQVSRTLIGQLPELGHASARVVSALVGLAPMSKDSGKTQGCRHIVGGRQAVRNVLYMAAVVASRHNEVCRALYERLLMRGKATKVALIAVAHKLLVIANAMIQNGTEWRPSKVAETP